MASGIRRRVRRAARILTHPTNKGARVRTLSRAVLVHARGTLLRKPTVIPLGKQSKFYADPRSTSSMRAVYADPPDAAEIAVWRRWLTDGDLFLDAGANVGLYSVLMAERGAEVVAVEPDSTSLRRLRANLDLNGYHAVEVVPSALGSSEGTVRFSVGADVYGHVVDDGGGVEVPMTTLDTLLGERYAAGVKVDVEGYERPVVEGLARALEHGRVGLLQLEWNAASEIRHGEGREALADLLESYGYQLYAPQATGALRALDGPPPGANVFAGQPDKVATLLG